MRKTIVCATVLLAIASAALAATLVIDDFEDGLDSGWKNKSFDGHTAYEVVQKDGRKCLSARADDSASGMYYKVEFDPKEYPWLAWSWKIDGIIEKGNARTKEGDDYAARVYVVFPSTWFWRTKAINYIWANHLEKDEVLPNAYTDNAMMIAVETGDEQAGRWVSERRNLVEDYRRCFGGDPPKGGAVAVMTDTDDTGEFARAWYDDIALKSE
ncbi:MAG: DUF3047 domain-containing protein [Desulfatibacillaceae bacterium]